MSFDAIVLAGGRARRLGGVSKPDVVVGGRTLLDRALDAAAGAGRVVVVGPAQLARPDVPTVLESPPSGGPVAGIGAGLKVLQGSPSAEVLVLACDVPQAAAVVPLLRAALVGAPTADGAVLSDADPSQPRVQIVALVRRGALVDALARVGTDGLHGVSFRRLCAQLTLVAVQDVDGWGADADTWDDVRRLDSLLSGGPTVENETSAGSDLHRWVVRTAAELGVDPDGLDVDLILDLSRDVAHLVTRPAVPLTSFLVGYAVALGGGDRAALERVVARTVELAAQWDAPPP